MKVLLDQNVPEIIKNWLRDKKPSWDVYHTEDFGFAGETDEKIYAHAMKMKAVLITFDEDFTDKRLFSGKRVGLIRLNVWPTTIEEIQMALTRLFSEIEDDEIIQSLVIIDNNKIRIRKL